VAFEARGFDPGAVGRAGQIRSTRSVGPRARALHLDRELVAVHVGKPRSSTVNSGGSARATASAALTVAATRTSCPSSPSTSARSTRASWLSSTSSTDTSLGEPPVVEP
jgi:hypothetical protein